ncbi:MAG: hypothetical protein K6G46_01505, partial [Prevotella sp.]|nr:hypothetical protein [Prevotella sp.]
PQGGIEGISKTLGDYPQALRSPYLHPSEAAPSPLGGGTFIPRRRHLHPFYLISSVVKPL